jgi:hypothetical protein
LELVQKPPHTTAITSSTTTQPEQTRVQEFLDRYLTDAVDYLHAPEQGAPDAHWIEGCVETTSCSGRGDKQKNSSDCLRAEALNMLLVAYLIAKSLRTLRMSWCFFVTDLPYVHTCLMSRILYPFRTVYGIWKLSRVQNRLDFKWNMLSKAIVTETRSPPH